MATTASSTATTLRDISGACFRANPDYQLVPLDRLPDDLRSQIGDDDNDAGIYGVLLPSRDDLTPKTACEDTAPR